MANRPQDDAAFQRGGKVGEKHSATLHLIGGQQFELTADGPKSYLDLVVGKWSRVLHELLERVEYHADTHDEPTEDAAEHGL